MEKKGISTIISTVVLIALVLVSLSIVWAVVSNLIDEKIDQSESCGSLIGGEKVFFNEGISCYNATSKEVKISIGIADVKVDKVLVSVAGSENSKAFEIGSPKSYKFLREYSKDYEESVIIPNENSGKTYYFNSTDLVDKPTTLKIVPVINGKQCEVTDVIPNMPSCSELV